MKTINKIAVLGAGTMGAGIAGVCANAGREVLLLDVQTSNCEDAKQRLLAGRAPVVADASVLDKIRVGNFTDDLKQIADCDWICEAVVEDVAIKREMFAKVESLRRDDSIVSSNTSGIPLRDIYRDMPERLQRDIAVTHFFNPVHLMKLVELVPGENTSDEVSRTLADFLGGVLQKGVVHAKDTVNFIGNRIGCFWMLSGLHLGESAMQDGINIETIDALMSKPLGFPPTGLYGLIDLIGLDVMFNVGKNLRANLPEGDAGEKFASLPANVQTLHDKGQLGRKSGGGFYKLTKDAEGNKSMQVFDLQQDAWRPAQPAQLADNEQSLQDLFNGDGARAKFVREVLLTTFHYAADLLPEIADDIVNIDRAMRWGFNWRQGPFEMMDALGAENVAKAMQAQGLTPPKMLQVLNTADAAGFYRKDGKEFLTLDGGWAEVPG